MCLSAVCRSCQRFSPLDGWHGARQRLVELAAANGLGQVVVHTRLEASLAVAPQRVRGDPDDRQAPAGLVGANGGGGKLEAEAAQVRS